jgi:hypothetical protein
MLFTSALSDTKLTMYPRIGRYALFQTVPKGQLYPARIVSRDGIHASLVWHSGNVYASGEAPASASLSREVCECSDAIQYSNLNAVSRFNVGSLLW